MDRAFTDRIRDHNKKGAWGWTVFQLTSGHCAYCGCELDFDGWWHLDHIIPRSKGGRYLEKNLIAACENCNLRKGPMTAEGFREWIPNKMRRQFAQIAPEMSSLQRFLSKEDIDCLHHYWDAIIKLVCESTIKFPLDQVDWEKHPDG